MQEACCTLDFGDSWARTEQAAEVWRRCLGRGWYEWLLKVPPPLTGQPCPTTRPCRYFQCRWHLAVEWSRAETPQLVTPSVRLADRPHTCLWDLVHDYPTGMTEEQVAECLGISQPSMHQRWKEAVDEFKKADPNMAAKMLNRFHDTEAP